MNAFRKRPYDSGILIMGSGAFILAIGIIAVRGYFDVGDQSTIDLVAIIIGSVAGAAIILSGLLSILLPSKHKLFGALAMIFSVVSFAGTSGGLYLGAMGGLLGGVMSISWKRNSPSKPDNKGEVNHYH